MTLWTLSNAQKKNIEEKSIWTKDGQTICRIEWYRWGTWTTESDERPDVDTDNPDGYDVYGTDTDWELVDMVDGVAVEWEFPEDMDEDARTGIEELYDEDGYSGLEEAGWENVDTEVTIYGPLDISSGAD